MAAIKISVIIPLFNREKLILETIDSLLMQVREDFECIIIDDHSSDSSYEIACNYVKNDSRFLVRKRIGAKKGAPACRNEGIDVASGSHIMFLDSDDLLDPICVEQRLSLIKENPCNDFYVFPVACFNHKTYKADHFYGNFSGTNDVKSFLNYTGGWLVSSTVFRCEFLKSNHYFDEEALSWQDVEFHIRAIAKTTAYLKFPSALPDVYVRISDEPRITNSSWSFNKIFSRIQLYLKLEEKLKEEQYNRYFLFFYFKYIEIGARKLNSSEYSKLKLLWFSGYRNKSRLFFLLLFYLNFQNFLTNHKMYFVGSTLYRFIRFLPWINLTLPEKATKLEKEIDIRERLAERFRLQDELNLTLEFETEPLNKKESLITLR